MAENPKNAVIAQSGGPTSVINQSLVGCLERLRDSPGVGRVYGARHAVRGMLEDDLVDLTEVNSARLEQIACTPSAALGSSRDKPDEEYCRRIFEALSKRDIQYFFYIGGNDSADTCRIVAETAKKAGYDLAAFHIPKTIDNDLVRNDHTPGYGSAARFVARAFMGDNLDNAALPGIKINVVMGRHAGFLTGAAALARQYDDDGPHLIYLPERPFSIEDFIDDVDRVFAKIGRCLIAVSEGIRTAEGEHITTKIAQLNETDPHGNVQLSGTGALGDGLAGHIRRVMGSRRSGDGSLRVRADTFGYLQRTSFDVSPVDAGEAREVGRYAAKVAREGRTSGSITINRVSDDPYRVRFDVVDLKEVAGKTRTMPDEFIASDHDNVSDAFLRYARPLAGELPHVERLL